ncbi:MAG: cupin domain-containing protein [Deltaproteobacteria bacterium]|nr:cupin domain-containing protein [Deltaproteobacteria bacterium]MBI3078461.1 cupin domain-containing protein [Deltaproteobacteria bacterium]
MNVRDVRTAWSFSADKMKKVGLVETDRMFCDVYCFEPGQEQKPHTHPGSDKVYVVLEGQGRFAVDGEVRELGREQLIHVPPGAEHGVTNPGPGRLVLLVFMAPKPTH